MGRNLLGHAAVIAPRSYWGKYLNYRLSHPEDDFILTDLPSLEDSLGHRFKKQAITELLVEGYSLEQASEMLSAMRFFKSDDKFDGEGEEKLRSLVPVFASLKEKGLYDDSILPLEQFKSRDIVIAGYGSGERISALLRELPNIAMSFDLDEGNALIEDDKTKVKTSLVTGKMLPAIEEFPDPIAGFHYLANRIADLLSSGVKPQDIVLLNYSSEFDFYLREAASFYSLPIQPPPLETLANTALGKKALNFLKGLSGDAETSLAALKEELGEQGAEIMGQIDFLSDTRLSASSLYFAARKILGRVKPKQEACQGAIKVTADLLPSPGQKGFFLDFSLNHAPKPYKMGHILDSDFLLKKAGYMGVEEAQTQAEADLLRCLRSPDILSFLYFGSVNGAARYLSPLVAKFHLSHFTPAPLNYEYSKSFAMLEAAEAKENEAKYKIPSARLSSISAYLGPIDEYQNAYRGEKAKQPLAKTSYSALSSYLECPFAYYCQRKLGLFGPDSFASVRGTASHAYLEKEGGEKGEAAFEEAIRESSYAFSPSERLLLTFAKEDVSRYCESFYSLIEGEKEHEVSMKAKLGADCALDGKIDLLCKLNGGYYVVDFKSSQAQSFIPERLRLGLGMQLPLYAFLSASSESEGFLGAFIASMKLERGAGDTRFDADCLSKFSGFYLYDPDMLRKFDPEVAFLPVNKKKKDPESLDRRKGAFGEGEFASFADKAKAIAETAVKGIEEGEFPISPIRILAKGSRNVDSCKYCDYRMICHKAYGQERAYREDYDKDLGQYTYTPLGIAALSELLEREDEEDADE